MNDFKQEQLSEWNAAKADRDAEKTYLDELTAEVAYWQGLKDKEADLELWRDYDNSAKAAKGRLDEQQAIFNTVKARFDEVDGAKSDREAKEAAEATAATFKAAYEAREAELTTFNTTITTLKNAITGIETDIAAQQAIMDAGNPGEAAYDAALAEKTTLEATKATKITERTTAEAEAKTREDAKAADDLATLAADAALKDADFVRIGAEKTDIETKLAAIDANYAKFKDEVKYWEDMKNEATNN